MSHRYTRRGTALLLVLALLVSMLGAALPVMQNRVPLPAPLRLPILLCWRKPRWRRRI